MPILQLNTSHTIKTSVQKRVSKKLIDITHHQLKKEESVTIVNINPEHGTWFNANDFIKGGIYQLNIFITESTNTNNEIAKWIHETWLYLKDELNIDETAVCYTSVISNDGANWGFNGITQSARKYTQILE